MGQASNQAEIAAKIERAMARELAPQPKQDVTLLEGLATGQLESAAPLRPECKRDEEGDVGCQVLSDLGEDADGSASSIACNATTYTTPFGVHVKAALQQDHLLEVPVVEVRKLGEGMVTSFVANAAGEGGVGTTKVATLYALGYTVSCVDVGPGARQTFRRVVDGFFESLRFKPRKDKVAVAALGYRTRAGDHDAGFHYAVVHKRPGQEGFLETSLTFTMKTDGKTWSVVDQQELAERSDNGTLEKLTDFYWVDGNGPAVLSAKPSEEGRYRLKLRVGSISNGFDARPQAPLTTPLWVGPELARLSSGALQTHTYARLAVEDSDPIFRYVTVSRSGNGVLTTRATNTPPGSAAAKKASKPEEEVEIHVDNQGQVTKQVTSESVSERIYTFGSLPRGAGLSATKPGASQ